jgi:hypothetical protein
LSGVLRLVLILVATALALYLVWRLNGVIQLLVISPFFAFALFPWSMPWWSEPARLASS